jgi:hypothetical protein
MLQAQAAEELQQEICEEWWRCQALIHSEVKQNYGFVLNLSVSAFKNAANVQKSLHTSSFSTPVLPSNMAFHDLTPSQCAPLDAKTRWGLDLNLLSHTSSQLQGPRKSCFFSVLSSAEWLGTSAQSLGNNAKWCQVVPSHSEIMPNNAEWLGTVAKWCQVTRHYGTWQQCQVVPSIAKYRRVEKMPFHLPPSLQTATNKHK